MSILSRSHARALSAPESGIVAVINHARGREGLIPLWAGEGDLPTPAFISETAARALAEGQTFYTHQRGIPELRQALARYAARLYGVPETPERFFVTGSGMHAIQTVLTFLAGPGDEVVFLGPLWPNLPAAASLAGARPVEVMLTRDAGAWSFDLERLRAAVSPRTRAIFVNSPNNPTGWTATREELAAILAIARDADAVVVADEIYAQFHYADGRAPSFHDVAGPDDPVVYVNSFSKNWAMTGWRIGWIEAAEELGAMIENLVQYSNSGVPAFLQQAAAVALDEGDAFVAGQVERAAAARDILAKALLATNRVEFVRPAGAFYAFFKVDGLEDSRAAALRIADEAGVGLAPGTAFGPGSEGFLRACFHRRLDEVEAAGDRLAGWIGGRA